MRLAVSILLLSGCAAHQANTVRYDIVGRSTSEAAACLGVPSHEAKQPDGTLVQEWDYQAPNSSASLPLAAIALLPITLPLTTLGNGSVAMAEGGGCHAVLWSRDGVVRRLVYTGQTNRLIWRDGYCDPVVKACFQEWKR